MSPNPRNRILIVDDDLDMREILSFDFESEGFQVLQAESGNRAIEILNTRAVDVVVTDVRMPDGDGVRLLERVNERYPDLPVIFLTGFAEIPIEDACARGAYRVLIKPFDRDELYRAVRQALQEKNDRPRRNQGSTQSRESRLSPGG